MEKMYVFNRIYPFKEKISLSKANLSKLSNEDLQQLYDLTIQRNQILKLNYELSKNFTLKDLPNYNIMKNAYKGFLYLIDELEQEILQKTL